MEVLPTTNTNSPPPKCTDSPPVRRGCNPVMKTQRSKMQSQRVTINQKLTKQLRMRAGAENLFNATSNSKVKETVALELSFLNSNLQLLKEELSSINSSVEPYQSRSGKTVNIPMIPLGMKDTNEIEFTERFAEIFSEHYGEDPNLYEDEVADLCDLRNAIRTPARNEHGISMLLEYYNQLYFIENRFYFPIQPAYAIYFHWYDSLTGIPSLQRSISLEKACVLFNVGALYSQIACQADRTKKKGIELALDHFQRAAGSFNYLRFNFSNAPTHDLTHNFLSSVTKLMLAQAQECVYEMKVFGGFEIELGKCVNIAHESMKVSDKYVLAMRGMMSEEVSCYVPYTWINMCEVKSLHYRALAHYYTAMGLLKQNEAAEPGEITKLISDLYVSKEATVTEDDNNDFTQRKEDRKRLGKAHLREARNIHESSIETYHLCKDRSNDVLKQYLQHAHNRTTTKLKEYEDDNDFFELSETPDIQAQTHMDSECISPCFKDAPVVDIFKRLGPLTVFSSRVKLGAHRVIDFSRDLAPKFKLKGDSPVRVYCVDDRLKTLGMCDDDVIIAVGDEDVRWKDRKYVNDLMVKNPTNLQLRLISQLGSVCMTSPTAGFEQNHSTENFLREGEVIQHNGNNNNNMNNNNNHHQQTMPNRTKNIPSTTVGGGKAGVTNNNHNKRNSISLFPRIMRDPFATVATSKVKGRKQQQNHHDNNSQPVKRRPSILGTLRRSGSQILFGSNNKSSSPKKSSNGHAF